MLSILCLLYIYSAQGALMKVLNRIETLALRLNLFAAQVLVFGTLITAVLRNLVVKKLFYYSETIHKERSLQWTVSSLSFERIRSISVV